MGMGGGTYSSSYGPFGNDGGGDGKSLGGTHADFSVVLVLGAGINVAGFLT